MHWLVRGLSCKPNIYVSLSTSELRVRFRLVHRYTGLSPPVKYFIDRSKTVLLLWIFYPFLSCVCYAFVHICLYVSCGHLLGKGWPLGSRLWVCHFPIGILGQVWYLIVSIPDLCTLTYLFLLRQGLSEHEFYGYLVYKLKKIVDSKKISAQFVEIISHCKKIWYNINVLQQTAWLVVNPITVGNSAFLFNSTPVGWTSDSLMVLT